MSSTTTAGAPTVAAGAVLAGVLTAYLVTVQPAGLQIDVDLSWIGVAVLAVAAGATLLIVREPAAGLALIAALVYLNLSEVLVREHGWPSFLQLLAIPLLLAAWADRRTPPLAAVLQLPLTRLLAVYVVLLLAGTILARDASLADDRVIEHAKMLVLFVTVAALASARGRIAVLAWAIVGAGTLLSAIGVVQAVSGNFANEFWGLGRIKYAQIYGDVFEPRIAGPLGDPNFFAQILLVLVPVALALARWEAQAWRRLLAYAAAAVIGAATVLTYSRGGALALGCVLALSLVDRKHRWRDLATGGALVVAAILLLPDNFTRRVTTLEQLFPGPDQTVRPDSSFEKRKLLVSTAWLMFLDHPLRGVGAANYTTRFDEYADEVGLAARDYDDPAERHYPHSLYLEIAAESGVPGVLLFGAIALLSLRYVVRARDVLHAAGDDRIAGIARGLGIAIVGYLISSIFLHGHFLRYLWLLFAAAAALHLASRGPRHREAPRVLAAEFGSAGS